MRAERVGSVDALRGVLALGVMVYHLAQWSGLAVPAAVSSVLSVVGIYAVEAFFAVSGFSLQHVYGRADFAKGRVLADFALRRVLRIAPLFLFALALVAGPRLLDWAVFHDPRVTLKTLEPARLALNASLLFGFVNPGTSMVVAGWSVGVEVVFYALFPAMIRWGRAFGLTIFAAIIGGLYTALALDPRPALGWQWAPYVAWINHLVFFVGGMAIAAARPRWPRLGARVFWPAVGFLAIAMAVVGQACHREIDLVVGLPRLGLSAATLVLVAGVGQVAFGPGRITRAFDHLGAISYGVYLLHYFAYVLISGFYAFLGPLAVVVLSAVLAVSLGTLSHRFLEMPALRLARRAPA